MADASGNATIERASGVVHLANFGCGVEGHWVTLGPLTVWFSYATPIAYAIDGEPRVVRRNDWGPTTGQHLADAQGDEPGPRVDGPTFEAGLAAILARMAEGA